MERTAELTADGQPPARRLFGGGGGAAPLRWFRAACLLTALAVGAGSAAPAAGLDPSEQNGAFPGSVQTAPPSKARPTETHPADIPAPAPAARKPRSFTIAATGDLLIHGPVADRARTEEGWDFTPMFDRVAPILRGADLALCHIESPMSIDNPRLSYYPRFRVPNQLAEAVRDAGYDSCSLASNHSFDWGFDSVRGTIEPLDRAGVARTGAARSPAERKRLNLLRVNGAFAAHLSYTYGLNTGPLPAGMDHLVNMADEAAVLDEARRARAAGAHFVILSLHWGTEYSRRPSAYQTGLGARLLSSPDIDLILGHHAHVVQPVAEIDGEYLAYGLGNFLSYQSHLTCRSCPAASQDGVILHFTVTEDPAAGRWRVSAVSHTPTRVDLTTFEIIDASAPAGLKERKALAASAKRTAAALSALGTPVPIQTWPRNGVDICWLYSCNPAALTIENRTLTP